MTVPINPRKGDVAGVGAPPWAMDPAVATLLDAVDTPIFVVAPDGTFLFINEACLRLIASPSREQSLKYNAFRLPSMRAAGADVLIRAALKGDPKSQQVDYVSMWGHRVTLQAELVPMRDPTGQVVAVAGALEHRQEKQELDQRLQHLSAELKTARQEIRSLESLRTRLLAKVSHELRTPLLPLHGYLKLLEDEALGPLTPKQEKAISVARRNTRRLIDLVEHTLQVTRDGAPRTVAHLRRIEPDVLVQDALDAMAPLLQSPDLHVVTHLPPGLPSLRGSRAQLTRVLMTLIDNAQKFASRPGTIEVHLEQLAPDAVAIDVSNSGQSIPASERDRVFEPFYQIEGTDQLATGGIGLGLSIAREALEQHGGTLSVLENPRLDTTLRIVLPAVRARPETTEVGVMRLLLVGGLPEDRQRLESLLDETGHDTRPVPLDDRLEERVRLWAPDAVLLDLGSGEPDPLAAIGRIKTLPLAQATPVIGLRPDDASHLDRAALDLGATATIGHGSVASELPAMLDLLQTARDLTGTPDDQ